MFWSTLEVVKVYIVSVFGVSLQLSDSLFLVPCCSNTCTLTTSSPYEFVIPVPKNGSVHSGKPFTEKVVVVTHISEHDFLSCCASGN